jgi:alkylation response protein AidB-like acyl-CoA dehydrogenase
MLLTETQTAIRDAVRIFAKKAVQPRSAEFERNGGYPPGFFETLAELGLLGLTASEVYGGVGADYVSYALALMELAAADGALSTIVSIQNSLLVNGLLNDGDETQRQRFLPDLIAGRIVGAFALTEADAGSDASAIRTRAEKVTGGYRINGAKQFITSGRIAGLALVFAVTEPGLGKRGISAFLVPTDRPGYFVDKVEHKLGQYASDTCALRFEDLFIEDDLRLGLEGRGYGIALANLEVGRIGIASQSVGMARAALEIAVAYAKDRTSFGAPIIAHQAVGFRLADLASRLEAARQLVLSAAALKDAGCPA